MSAETHKEKIIQSNAAKRIVSCVSPIYEDSYVGCWIFEVIGREWDRIWKIIDDLPDQLFPATATWSIGLWEERYGITPNEGDTLEQRRSRILQAEAPPEPFTPWSLMRYVKAMCGREVEINEHSAPYTFTVTITNTGSVNKPNYEQIKKYIKKHKPSHMAFELLYSDECTIPVYNGIVVCGMAITMQSNIIS